MMKPDMRLSSVLLAALAAAPTALGASGLSYNGLSITPAMGWDTYNAYALDYNETTIRDNANLLVSLGFRDLGYKVVIFDDAMTERNRSSNGSLVENASKFPNGLKNLVDSTLHSQGLLFGVYSSAGRYTCGGYAASLGYEQVDAAWWASLGADYLKYDNCYNEGMFQAKMNSETRVFTNITGNSGTPQLSEHRYAVMSNALNSTGRNITYSLCNWGDDKPWEWASTISNSARISGDIQDYFDRPATSCPCGPDEYYCELPGYGCSVFNILGKASHITSKNQPGYWNDLDMLEVGNGGMSYDEYKTHFSMWAAIKSPLIMGNKLTGLSPEDYGILTNPAVIALNQDPNGSPIQRQLVQQVDARDRYGVGEIQIWSGSLYGGDQVVAFLNAANTSLTIAYDLVEIFGGLPTNEQAQMSYDLYDLWGNETVIPVSAAAQILNGNATIETVDNGRWYYNATATSWADGLAANDTLLLGTPAGSLQAGGLLSAEVPSHGIAMWRLKSTGSAMKRKRDEL